MQVCVIVTTSRIFVGNRMRGQLEGNRMGLSCINASIVLSFRPICKSIHTKISIQITDNCFHRMSRGKHKSKAPMQPQELHKVAKQPRKGVRLTSQSKTIIDRVRQYFEGEKQKGRHINVLKKTAAATGVSVATVKQIYSEQKTNDGTFLTPVR